jgi:CubicO group peptidase (beta-lactamase class C family)
MFADRVVDTIERHLEAGVVGASIAIVVGDEVRATGGFGRLDIDRADAVTAQTRFPIQSVTKTIVASALMQWVERGAIGLDDPVNRHLAPIAVANEWEAHSPVTIRRLLTHTGGLPVSVGWGSSASLEEMVANEVATEFEPGTRLIYANWGYNVLGHLIARLAGVPWDQAVDAEILQPLGMRATTAAPAVPEARNDDLVTGHFVSQLDEACFRVAPETGPFSPGPPSGSLISNVDDLARFLVAQLNGGGPILASDTVADMHRVHAPLGNGGGGMGLGFRVDRRGGRAFFCHGGDGAGCTNLIAGYPHDRVGVALLLNTAGAQTARSEIARAALDSVLDTEASSTRSTGAVTPPANGRYRSTYWGVPAEVTDADGVPAVNEEANAFAFAASVSHLTDLDGRWRAEGGMFDGYELDFDTANGTRRFFGGVYPFEFVGDETQPVGLPADVETGGTLTGRWTGTTDTPFGAIPLELDLGADQVAVAIMGTGGTDDHAEVRDGWIRAQFAFDLVGFGPIVLFMRLGRVEGRLEGLLWARYEGGEVTLPTVLEPSP